LLIETRDVPPRSIADDWTAYTAAAAAACQYRSSAPEGTPITVLPELSVTSVPLVPVSLAFAPNAASTEAVAVAATVAAAVAAEAVAATGAEKVEAAKVEAAKVEVPMPR